MRESGNARKSRSPDIWRPLRRLPIAGRCAVHGVRHDERRVALTGAKRGPKPLDRVGFKCAVRWITLCPPPQTVCCPPLLLLPLPLVCCFLPCVSCPLHWFQANYNSPRPSYSAAQLPLMDSEDSAATQTSAVRRHATFDVPGDGGAGPQRRSTTNTNGAVSRANSRTSQLSGPRSLIRTLTMPEKRIGNAPPILQQIKAIILMSCQYPCSPPPHATHPSLQGSTSC